MLRHLIKIFLIFNCCWMVLAVTTSEQIQVKKITEGIVLRVPAYNYPPLFSIQRDQQGNFTYHGVIPEIIVGMASYFNMTFRYIHVDASQVTKHGLGRTVVQQLLLHEVDMLSFPVERSADNDGKIDLLYPSYIQNYALLQPWPKEESRLTIIIQPFSITVWLSFAGCVVIFIGLMSWLTFYFEYKNENRISISSSAIWDVVYIKWEFVIAVISSQGTYQRNSRNFSVRMLTACWLLVMIVLVNAYAGVLTAILAVPKLKPTIDTFEQLVETKELHLTIERNSLLTRQFLDATSGTYKQIGDSLRQNPELLFGDALTALVNVVDHQCAYPATLDMIKFFIRSDLKTHGKCRITVSAKELSYYMSFHLGITKRSPYADIFSHRYIIYMWENGLATFMKRKYLPGSTHCRAGKKIEGQKRAFKLADFISAFFLLGIGLSFSIFIFALESICAWKDKR